MKTRYLLSCLLVLLLGFCNSCKMNDQKNDASKMFLLNAIHQNKFSDSPINSSPEILWKFKTNGPVISSPTIANGVLYIGSDDGKLYAIEALSGELLWTFQSGSAVRSSPAYAEGKVLFLSYDGFFYALEAENGTLIWKFKTEGESPHLIKDYFDKSFKPDFWDFYLSSPVITEGRLFFGSGDHHIYALNISSGELIWKYKTNGVVHASPAISKNNLVVGSFDGNMYCIDINSGMEKWVFETEKDTAQYIWLGNQASPSIAGDMVYFGSRDAKFYAVRLQSGDTLWTSNRFDRSWMPSTAVVDSTTIYTGSSDSFAFFALERNSGRVKYKTTTDSYTFSSPAIDDEMAYIGSANGFLYGIGLDTGHAKWKFKTTGIPTDTIRMFDKGGKMDGERMNQLYRNIRTMQELSTLYTNAFVASGAILSTPTKYSKNLYFGSSDGFIYALTSQEE